MEVGRRRGGLLWGFKWAVRMLLSDDWDAGGNMDLVEGAFNRGPLYICWVEGFS